MTQHTEGHWHKIYATAWQLTEKPSGCGKLIASLDKQSYGRKLWTIEINNKHIVVDGYDCFTLGEAKKIVNAILKAKGE